MRNEEWNTKMADSEFLEKIAHGNEHCSGDYLLQKGRSEQPFIFHSEGIKWFYTVLVRATAWSKNLLL